MAASKPVYFSYPTIHGEVTIQANDKGVMRVELGNVRLNGANKPSPITNQAATELQEYLAGKRERFDVGIAPEGSAFQQCVWTELTFIPYGETATCEEIAANIGKAGSYRSVGSAISRNPLPFIIPSHRIVNAKGATPGTGKMASLSRALLKMERAARG